MSITRAAALFGTKKIKSSLYSLKPFRVSRVSGAHLRSFATGPTHQGCNSGELLATCGRFDRLGGVEPYTSRTRSERLNTCVIWPVLVAA